MLLDTSGLFGLLHRDEPLDLVLAGCGKMFDEKKR
jgi:hypothetical protein